MPKNKNHRNGTLFGEKTNAKKNLSNVKVFSLGGLNEIGKNMYVVEYEEDIVVIDCGIGFPDDDMLGVDLVIPDVSYLEKNADRVRGIFLTHGHEDHIGALPYVLRTLNVPVYGTRLTLGVLKYKLEEHHLLESAKLNEVKAGDVIEAGVFKIEFIHVNHSIADACCLAITTPQGIILHTGDFKLDITPIEGEMMDITRLGELGREGVALLLCESTNIEHSGYTPSEQKVGLSFDNIFMRNTDKRIIIATFSSNVHRVQQIINASVKYGRKIAITGRSMLNIVKAATELGYMNVPEGSIIDVNELGRFNPEQVTIITTGSQGEPMSALYRMAFGDHSQIHLDQNDLVVLSSHTIPGNEKLIGNILNEMYKKGVSVFHDQDVEVHVSGHARQEEIKLMHALTKPKFFVPIHGEYKMMARHKEVAHRMGMDDDRIFILDIGQVLEFNENEAKVSGSVQAGRVLIDGYGIGDVGNIVLRDRKLLSQDGIIIVVATVDINERMLISGPDIVSRGFVYVRESEELMDRSREICTDALLNCLDQNMVEWNQMKASIKDSLSRFLYQQTKRRPMVLPIIMNV
ncbi:MAG: ribonuclease J [Clostridia bacterium]|nr:ribonuclease J [Clostridia bacterium]